MKIALRVAAAVAVIPFLSGCFKIDVDLTVTSDDTVNGTMIFAVDASVAELVGLTEEQLRDELENALNVDSLPEGTSAGPYTEGELVGTRLVLEGVALEDFNTGATEGDLRIVHEDDRYIVSGTIDLTAEEAGVVPTGEPEAQISITLPAEVIEHNGELSGQTVTWRPPVGEQTTITAIAEESDDGAPAWLWPLLGIAVVGAAAAVYARTRRRQPAEPAEPPATPGNGA